MTTWKPAKAACFLCEEMVDITGERVEGRHICNKCIEKAGGSGEVIRKLLAQVGLLGAYLVRVAEKDLDGALAVWEDKRVSDWYSAASKDELAKVLIGVKDAP